MESGIKYVLLPLLFSTEILFVLFAIFAIKKIIYTNNYIIKSSQHKLKLITIIFLVFAIISEISYGFLSFLFIGKIIYVLFLIFELYFIFYLQRVYIHDKKINLVFSTLLISLSPFFISLITIKWDITILNSTLAVESFIVGCICLYFFNNLKNKITNNQLINEQGTLLMLGLFFCYSIPLPFNATIAILSMIEKNISDIKNSHFYIYFSLSRIGTICYILFFYFIRKAFNEKYR